MRLSGRGGEVLTSQETTEETEDPFVRLERSRTAHLKGVANPMTLYRAVSGVVTPVRTEAGGR